MRLFATTFTPSQLSTPHHNPFFGNRLLASSQVGSRVNDHQQHDKNSLLDVIAWLLIRAANDRAVWAYKYGDSAEIAMQFNFGVPLGQVDDRV